MKRIIIFLAVLFGIALALVGLGILGIQAAPPPGESRDQSALIQTPVPTGPDLDVTYISREPMYFSYCNEYPHPVNGMPGLPILCPGTENDPRWPAPGEVVTFTAHIINKGVEASGPFDGWWQIDGTTVLTVSLPSLAMHAEITTSLSLPWPHGLDGERLLGEHTVGFWADPQNTIPETYKTNNLREDRTDALSLRIVFTPAMYAAYNMTVDYNKYPYSTEDWIQKQVAAMNQALADSTYPFLPQGATVRLRINSIEIADSYPSGDRSHDGGWFVNADYRHGASGYYDPATDIDWGLVHELGHQAAMIDLYASGIYGSNVFALDRFGDPSNFSFYWPRPDIMFGGDTAPHNDPHLYSSHSAGGISSTKGYRNGYYGAYQFDIPYENYLRVLDNQGQPADGVQVTLYQRLGPLDWTQQWGLDNTPEITGTTGQDGCLLLPNRSAEGGTTTRRGQTLRDNPFGVVDIVGTQNLFLVKLDKGEHEEFAWLDITAFNLAYWQGDTISHTYTITAHVPLAGAPASPSQVRLFQQGAHSRLEWAPSPSLGVAGYNVYRATPPDYPYVLVSGLVTATTWEEDFDGEDGGHRVYVVTAVDAQGRESAFSRSAYAPLLHSPLGVAAMPGGSLVALDPWSFYPLLRLSPGGRYVQRLASPHWALGEASSLASDSAGRLYAAIAGTAGSGKQQVRVYQFQGAGGGLPVPEPMFEFGEEGSAPGQLLQPGGLAYWGVPLGYGGPYAVDQDTLFLAHFDGSLDGEQGEVPSSASGVTFASGQHAQGALVAPPNAVLTYPTLGNLNRTQGAIEFWVCPRWTPDDRDMHIFFETEGASGSGLQIGRDGNGYLHFVISNPSSSSDVGTDISMWKAGECHHIAVTWQGSDAALYVDGGLRDRHTDATPPLALGSYFCVGCSLIPGWQADAVIDELRISATPRLGNSDTCGRILVADRGNSRLQAFTCLGDFVTTYGVKGTGPGQFNGIQGLAVDGQGRVLVADRDNARLQVLSFDGQGFAFVKALQNDLVLPTGVAVSGDRIVVTDLGDDRVKVFDFSGNLLATYSAPNDGYVGPFQDPQAVAVDALGQIWVADSGTQRVVRVRGALSVPRLWLPVLQR